MSEKLPLITDYILNVIISKFCERFVKNSLIRGEIEYFDIRTFL
jgi:hypothetical protein